MSNMVSLRGARPVHTRKYMRSMDLRERVRLPCSVVRYYFPNTALADIAKVGAKVIDFYKKKGGEVVSPLLKAL
jgi:hypothetical protein